MIVCISLSFVLWYGDGNCLLACLIAIWNICRDDFTAARQSKLPMTTTPTAPSASTAPAISTDDKVPKTWPKGVYQQLITDYKVSTGNTKTFPEKIILGAEQVVIRMWHEHTVSKNYQAVGLGEIITKRTFTATGSVNSTAKRDKSDKTLVLNPDDHTLVQQEQKDWDPQSMMMILDSLDAIRWAWILIQISNQESIDTYIERFIQLTRKNPQRLPNVKEAWDTFSWTIAMQMRNNMTFKQATEEILQDPVTIADILSQPPRKKPRAERARTRKARERARPKTSTIRGRPIPDTSHIPPYLPILCLFHLQHHRATNIIIMAHPLLHLPSSAHKPKDITRATRTKADTSLPSPRNRDSTATGRQHASQLTDQGSKPCCKAFYQNHRSHTSHFSTVSVSPSWPCSTSTLTSSRHSLGRLTPFAMSSLITGTINKLNIWEMLLRQTSLHFADNLQTPTTTPMWFSLPQHLHAKTIREYEMHHQGSPAAMGPWSSRWPTLTTPSDNTYPHTPFDPWWRMSYLITMYKTNSVTFPPNGAQTPSLLTQPMDKSPQDLDCGGLTPIGSMLAINSQDQHLSHYIGHYKTDITSCTTPLPLWSNRRYTWKTGKLRQSFATNSFSIASRHRLLLTWDDHHQLMHMQTTPHGRDGNRTIDSSHHGNTNLSSLLPHTKVNGNRSPHSKESDLWHCQTTTPRSQTNTHPLAHATPCWATLGISHQLFGY